MTLIQIFISLTAFLGASGGLIAAVASLRNSLSLKETKSQISNIHVMINSRMDEMLTIARRETWLAATAAASAAIAATTSATNASAAHQNYEETSKAMALIMNQIASVKAPPAP